VNDDRRRYPRSAVRIDAVERRGSDAVPRTVTNLSAGGFFVEAPGILARVGDLLVIELPDVDGHPFRVTGEVAYVTGEGVGVHITRADWERLSHLLAERVET
jgi:hypothetical protein